MTLKKIVVIAHNIRSLWNVGSLFRTCDGFAIDHLYLTGYTGHPPRKEITKTALGAETFVSWSQNDQPLQVVEDLKRDGYNIVSLEQSESSMDIDTFSPKFPLCLILGNEIAGVHQEILNTSDAVVHIPMHGQKESFNVAVAAGIALSIIRRKSIED